MLQGEVERVHRKERQDETPNGFRSYWQWIVLAGTVCLLLAAMLWPGEKHQEMAAIEDTRPAPVMRSADLPPATEPAVSAGRSVLPSLAPQTEKEEAKQAAPPAAIAEGANVTESTPPAQDLAEQTTSARASPRRLAAAVPRQKAVEPEARARTGTGDAPVETAEGSAPVRLSADALAKSADLANLGAAIRVRFQRVTNQAPAGAGATLLHSFYMEQLGTDLRLVDADGSIYQGQLTLEEGDLRDSPARAEADSRSAQPSAPARANTVISYFQATGANLTLGKKVVLTGELVERTNSAPAAELGFTFERRAAARERLASEASEPRRRIVGTAVIDETNQVPVEAFSTSP